MHLYCKVKCMIYLTQCYYEKHDYNIACCTDTCK